MQPFRRRQGSPMKRTSQEQERTHDSGTGYPCKMTRRHYHFLTSLCVSCLSSAKLRRTNRRLPFSWRGGSVFVRSRKERAKGLFEPPSRRSAKKRLHCICYYRFFPARFAAVAFPPCIGDSVAPPYRREETSSLSFSCRCLGAVFWIARVLLGAAGHRRRHCLLLFLWRARP